MSAEMSLINKIMLYEDATASNNPEKQLLNYQVSIDATLTNYRRDDIQLTGVTVYTVTLPAATAQYAYILTDAVISARFDGDLTDNVVVAPTVSGTKNGVFLKRGAFTDLKIAVGTGVTANVTIFLGA